MANNWFSFKHFKINQDQCAMKVSTDACLFGAWCAQQFSDTVLDIGAGTGLLSLMYAQKNKSKITAIEIEEACFKQCTENVLNSKYSQQIYLINDDVNDWIKKSDQKYSLIISNPPFYTHQFPSSEHQKLIARHDAMLSHNDLLDCVVSKIERDNGIFKVLLPSTEDHLFELKAMKQGLYLSRKIMVRDNHLSNFKRVMCEFGFSRTKIQVEEFTIKKADGTYSKSFEKLLSDYYLIF